MIDKKMIVKFELGMLELLFIMDAYGNMHLEVRNNENSSSNKVGITDYRITKFGKPEFVNNDDSGIHKNIDLIHERVEEYLNKIGMNLFCDIKSTFSMLYSLREAVDNSITGYSYSSIAQGMITVPFIHLLKDIKAEDPINTLCFKFIRMTPYSIELSDKHYLTYILCSEDAKDDTPLQEAKGNVFSSFFEVDKEDLTDIVNSINLELQKTIEIMFEETARINRNTLQIKYETEKIIEEIVQVKFTDLSDESDKDSKFKKGRKRD